MVAVLRCCLVFCSYLLTKLIQSKMPSRKNRTPSKCREWERERRNRFNEACLQLAALISEHFGTDTSSNKSAGNLAKIEIIQRAITFIKELLQQKSQMDTKLLAAQAEVNDYKNVVSNKMDASTQVNKQLRSIPKGSRIKKVLWRETVRKEKRLGPNNKDQSVKTIHSEVWKSRAVPLKLPKLLPKSTSTEKKGSDKTVFVLPATPFILPHRSLMLPPVPPTFVLLESFNQNSRNTMPIMPRVVSEITKTTMVNNIPIAAYSFPLSVAKNKKTKASNNISITKTQDSVLQKRQLKVLVKKGKKILSKNVKVDANKTTKETKENAPPVNVVAEGNTCSKMNTTCQDSCGNKLEKDKRQTETSHIPESLGNEKDNGELSNLSVKNIHNNKDSAQENIQVTENAILQTDNKQNNENYIESVDVSKLQSVNCVNNKIENDTTTIQRPSSITHEQASDSGNKNKQDKIQSILDSSMCDNTVDGGNARLELAEEFLAASPTAAFLMSFPLVSGVRADSPPDEEHHSVQPATIPRTLSNVQHKNDHLSQQAEQHHTVTFFSKSSDLGKSHRSVNPHTPNMPTLDFSNKEKLLEKQQPTKTAQSLALASHSTGEHSFLNLVPPMLNGTTLANDTMFSLDFEGHFSKNTGSTHSYVNSNNLLFKNDPFNTKTNNISVYSNNSLPVGHDYNNFGLYPCAMEKYSNKMNKSEYLNTDDSFVKVGSTRLTYDLDLGLPQKPYEFTTNVTNASNITKDNIFSTVTSFQTSSYNPFNPDFHMTLPPTTSANSLSMKKGNIKTNPFYTDTFTNLYSQPSTLWPEEINLYSNNSINMSKTSNTKSHQSNSFSNQAMHTNYKYNNPKMFDSKAQSNHINITKPSKLEVNQLVTDKSNHKKSPSKTHINWMTSEARPSHNNLFEHQHNIENKDLMKTQMVGAASHSTLLPHLEYSISKKQEYVETNYFPISMQNITAQTNQDDVQLWSSTRPIATAEYASGQTIDPPPINLPTLVGDLALGPNERRKSVDRVNRGSTAQPELASCNNFLSVTQLMNRSTEVPVTRHSVNENQKPLTKNDHLFTYSNAVPDKPTVGQTDTNNMQPCYFFNDSKSNNSSNVQFNHNQPKTKSHKVSERTKCIKNNYSTEALLKGANNVHKVSDNYSSLKFTNPPQKYPGYTPSQEGQMAQVSHFPCLTDYGDNSYSGSGLYNAGTNTVSNSFYSNLISGGSGIMSSTYAPSNFTPDFMDYSSAAAADCNFTYPRFDNFKMKNHSDTSGQVKFTLDLPKVSQKEYTGKHKTDFSKKEHYKKYPSKKPKMSNEMNEWDETPDAAMQTKHLKKNTYNMSEEMTFSNYLVNQGGAHTHHLPELLSYVPSVGPPSSNSRPPNCPTNVTRTNFNLSTLFPEIAKKVQ